MAENTLYLDWARDVLDTEAEGLREIAAALNHDFVRAAEALLHCKGRVVITGMGKSGHIGRKMAATMASTGTPAFFRPSCRSGARRFGHDCGPRCRGCHFQFRRKR